MITDVIKREYVKFWTEFLEKKDRSKTLKDFLSNSFIFFSGESKNNFHGF